jgi:8-oxo-dGTP pyrophosphatase MutT (NUDIX family)
VSAGASESEREPSNAPATARAAATVVLLRDGETGVEVFLVQRHGSLGFMGGMHVFPGGKVAESDTRAELEPYAPDAGSVARHMWGPDVDQDQAFARAVAAIRETYEEAGVLLCAEALGPGAAAARARLLAGAPFAEVLAELRVRLQLGSLQPLSRWITPESEPVRFDTSFYVARAPAGQTAEHDRTESVAGLWLSLGDALARAEADAIRLAPPTALTLESLLGVASVEAAVREAARRPPPLVMPVIRTVGDEVVIYYPGDPEHPVREPAPPGPTRRLLRRHVGASR